MSELVLEHLRALRAVIDSINGKVDQLTVRVGSIEQGIAVLHQDVSNLRSIVATVKRGREYPRADYRPITQEEWGNDD